MIAHQAVHFQDLYITAQILVNSYNNPRVDKFKFIAILRVY